MKTTQKLLALILCLAMLLNMGITAFAADENNSMGVTYSASLDKPTIEVSDTDQTVTMTISTNKPVIADAIGFKTVWDSKWGDIVSIQGGENVGAYDSIATNLKNGMAGWLSPDGENVSNITELAIITFKVPANTPAGTYNLGVTELQLTSDYGEIWENAASASTTLTITDGSAPSEGEYSANITSTTTTEAYVGDTVTVSVNVESGDSNFNASEVVVSYSDNLTFVRASSGETTVKNGSVKLEDYGDDKTTGNGVYTLTFTANVTGAANITLTSAGFGTGTSAETKNLTAATITGSPISFTVKNEPLDVTLPPIFSGNSTAEYGEDYTFRVEDTTGAYYDYSNVTATMNGEPVIVIDNRDGTWTIENVTGDLVISGTRTPKSYSVTFDAYTPTNDGVTAKYGTDYHFTLPNDVAAGTTDGKTYALTSVTIGGVAYTGYSNAEKTYTIPGTDVTGDIVITITETVVPANKVTVNVDGNAASDAAGTFPQILDKGSNFTLTLNPQAGYTYTVKLNGNNITLTDNKYTINNIQNNVTFTINKSIDTTAVAVSEYVKLNGTSVWLIKNTTAKLTGSLYTYKGDKMFWSEKYKAYCTLVVSDTMPAPTAADFAIITGTVSEVDYDGDVNMTSKVDANDAQLVYNIYNAQYTGFTANVTLEKFLRADVNGDTKVDVEDASAIVSFLLV